MPIPLRDIRRHAGYEREGTSALADALEGSQWHRGARCRGCGFLERASTGGPNGHSAWRCVNGWHDYWKNHGWNWYRQALAEHCLSTDHLVAESERQFPRYEAHPGSFACWLFRPGEALSTNYWRNGRWAEYLALQALAGV